MNPEEKKHIKDVNKAKNTPQSAFSKFMFATAGYDFYHKNTRLDKWEAWHISQDAKALLAGEVNNVRAVKREIEKSENKFGN